jgi:hypothetical protein
MTVTPTDSERESDSANGMTHRLRSSNGSTGGGGAKHACCIAALLHCCIAALLQGCIAALLQGCKAAVCACDRTWVETSGSSELPNCARIEPGLCSFATVGLVGPSSARHALMPLGRSSSNLMTGPLVIKPTNVSKKSLPSCSPCVCSSKAIANAC